MPEFQQDVKISGRVGKDGGNNHKSGKFTNGSKSLNGFDFDLDDVLVESNFKEPKKKKNQVSAENKNKLSSKENSLENEFDVNDEIFRDKTEIVEDLTPVTRKTSRASLDDYKGKHVGHNHTIGHHRRSSPLPRHDIFGRSVGGESLESSLSGLDISPASSTFSTMSKIQFSNLSSASSRHSTNSINFVPNSMSRHRSYSSNSIDTRLSPRDRRSSAGSVLSTGSHSPGLPRKVGNPGNSLTPGLGAEKKRRHISSRGHTPVFS